MTKNIALFLLITLFSSALVAQDKELTLEDAIVGRWTKFRPRGLSNISWVPGSSTLAWINSDTANPGISIKAYPNGESTVRFTLSDLKSVEGFEESKRFPRFSWLNANEIKVRQGQAYWSINLDDKSAKELYRFPEKSANHDVKNNRVAYTKGQNLWILDGGSEIQITKDDQDGIVNGQSVHRFEFGIHQGTFWSNSGDHLAFYRKDESMVSNYPLANYTTTPAEATPVRYPMAGMASHEVTVGVYDLKNKTTVWLKTGEPADQYLTNIAWGPEDKFIYVAVLNRDQNHMKLNQYDAKSGEYLKTIFEEKDEKYVQPLHPMEFLPDNKEQFLWQSERDGYNHVYLYNLKGKVIKQITSGEWVVTATHGFDSDGNLVLTRSANRGMDRLVYKYNLKSAKGQAWMDQSGTHRVLLNDDATYAVDVFNSLETAYLQRVIGPKGNELEELKRVDNPLKDYKVSNPELGVIKTNEGIELNTRMFKPYDFDPNKKYKALVYVYNGPGVQLITNSWMAGAALWMPYMANKGYIVFTVDGRGSENRGKEFEQKIFRQLGEFEIVDQLSGVEYLRNLDYVDGNKMAVHGWSYGGFMTTSLMLKAPGIFQVGVAGGPVIDWKYYEIMYTERYMDTPESNTAGFARASLLDKVNNLKGDLLLIHGADDDVVVPQHSIDLIKNAVDQGVQLDFFLYPGHKHNVRGKDRVHLMRKVLDYIDDKLE